MTSTFPQHVSGQGYDEPRFLVDSMLGRTCRLLRCCGVDAAYMKQKDWPNLADKAERDNRVVLTRDRNLPAFLRKRRTFGTAQLGRTNGTILFSQSLGSDSDESEPDRAEAEDSDSDLEASPANLQRRRSRSPDASTIVVYVVKASDPRDQLDEIIREFAISISPDRFFTRCVKCNCDRWMECSSEEAKSRGVSDRTLEMVKDLWQCGSCQQVYWEGKQFESAMDWLMRRYCPSTEPSSEASDAANVEADDDGSDFKAITKDLGAPSFVQPQSRKHCPLTEPSPEPSPEASNQESDIDSCRSPAVQPITEELGAASIVQSESRKQCP
uniref:Mut7-C RNAse domain-containing protein n=1 Tax=Cyanoptyche gloeocystis TaxID=77922 RepID=A0A7S2JLR2_9EUKA|mmetsp:Transcript_2202/g.4087  ORF Transcript_2202/g.4087 Transcript_2202/m.4087 type:complete len:327 (+) Transcript_2202:8-988(+)